MRRIALSIVLAFCALACGDSSPPLAETSSDRLQLEVDVRPDPLVSGQPATFGLRITNTSDRRAALTFDTTQHGDVALSSQRVEVYRWAERRAFAMEETQVTLVPGQHVSYALDEARLPVAPGEYELLAVVTGLPKLQTIHDTLTVVDPAAAATPGPSETARPAPTTTPEPAGAYGELASAVDTTVEELALPLASALANSEEFDADGAIVREQLADGFGRLTFAELALALAVVEGGDESGARELALADADRLADVFARLRSVEPDDRRSLSQLLTEHVAIVQEYAEVVAAGGGAALEVPRQRLDDLAEDLGPFVAVTAGGVVDVAAATELFATWDEALTKAIEEAGDPAAVLERAHIAATTAVEPLALDLGEAYAEYLDLAGYDSTAAKLRQELTTQLTEELLLLATAAEAGALEQPSAVEEVLQRNADELAKAVGLASAVDASEASTMRERWEDRDAALIEAVTEGSGEERLAELDGELAEAFAEAADGALAAEEVRAWLEAQRASLLQAVRGLWE